MNLWVILMCQNDMMLWKIINLLFDKKIRIKQIQQVLWNGLRKLQERAFMLMRMMLASVGEAIAYLRAQLAKLIPVCLKDRQPSRLTTLECLEAQPDPMLDIVEYVVEGVKKCAA